MYNFPVVPEDVQEVAVRLSDISIYVFMTQQHPIIIDWDNESIFCVCPFCDKVLASSIRHTLKPVAIALLLKSRLYNRTVDQYDFCECPQFYVWHEEYYIANKWTAWHTQTGCPKALTPRIWAAITGPDSIPMLPCPPDRVDEQWNDELTDLSDCLKEAPVNILKWLQERFLDQHTDTWYWTHLGILFKAIRKGSQYQIIPDSNIITGKRYSRKSCPLPWARKYAESINASLNQ